MVGRLLLWKWRERRGRPGWEGGGVAPRDGTATFFQYPGYQQPRKSDGQHHSCQPRGSYSTSRAAAELRAKKSARSIVTVELSPWSRLTNRTSSCFLLEGRFKLALTGGPQGRDDDDDMSNMMSNRNYHGRGHRPAARHIQLTVNDEEEAR